MKVPSKLDTIHYYQQQSLLFYFQWNRQKPLPSEKSRNLIGQ